MSERGWTDVVGTPCTRDGSTCSGWAGLALPSLSQASFLNIEGASSPPLLLFGYSENLRLQAAECLED